MDNTEKYMQILTDLAEAWNTLNAKKIFQYLDDTFI